MNRSGTFLNAMAFLLSLTLFGCGEKGAEPVAAKSQKAAPNAQRQELKAKEKIEVVEPPKYVYEPAGRRDPFEPLIVDKAPSGKDKAVVGMSDLLGDEPLTPLQQYEISQFRLIGVIIGKGKPTAMVVAPDGKAYVLKKGIKVGKNNGVVKEISASAVLIEELYQDLSGEMLKNELEIKLPKREGA